MLSGHFYQQIVGIPMGTNCASLIAHLVLNSYEVDFMQGLFKKNEKKITRSYKFTFPYVDDVLTFKKKWFGDYLDRIYYST